MWGKKDDWFTGMNSVFTHAPDKSQSTALRLPVLENMLKFYILAYSVFLQTLTEDLCHAGLAFHLG